MKILVIGGTGTVGSHVVSHLLADGHQVRVLTTSTEKAGNLPAGVEGVIGSLEYDYTLPNAFENIEGVYMLNAHTRNEIFQGLNAIAAALRAGVSKFVYQSIHQVRGKGSHIDHFRSKIMIEDALTKSGLNYVMISPNNFYQNDLWFTQAITQWKSYPQPIGPLGLSRVDVRDIAEVVSKVMVTDRYDGQTIALAGPEILTGERTAELLTESLGYDVNYAGDDLDQFRASFSPFIPGWMLEDWAEMYDFFQKEGLAASGAELNQLTAILGRPPRTYQEFLNDHLNLFAA
ncbi:MAG TPA: NmrA family NAD(P)-binding protein [Mucilaginibacter sp.]|jgi:uncharacterized protein YbjT (DUF2867 family)|nr:NmrA family NAD(P)-binding protein [Mucilaginibacter sp.]